VVAGHDLEAAVLARVRAHHEVLDHAEVLDRGADLLQRRRRDDVGVPLGRAQLRERDLTDAETHVSACRPGTTRTRMVERF